VLKPVLHPKCRLAFAAMVLAIMVSGCGRDQIQVYRVPKEKPASASASLDHSHNKPHLHWDLPPTWREEAAGGMRAASFSVPHDKGQAIDVSVIPMPGRAGSELDSVNLWRNQLRLAELQDAADLSGEAVNVSGIDGRLYELVSEEPLIEEKHKVRVLGAIIPAEETTWFVKMTGEDSGVQAQKPAFKQFLSSLSIHEADAHDEPPAAAASPQPSGQPAWEVPAGWTEAAAPPMVLKQFTIEEAGAGRANVTITPLPGEAGGMLANVNRWRVQQLGLPAATAEELSAMTRSFDVMGGKATLVEMSGTDSRSGRKARMLVAVVPREGQTWFYKLMGDESLVSREKDNFVHFVQTARY
jgi:hypothetical protein